MKRNHIAIIKLSSLGDVLHTIPAFSLLRKNYPQAVISWIAEPAAAELLKNFNGLNAILSIHLKRPGLSEKLKEVKRFLRTYKNSFDLLFDFQGLMKSALLTNRLGGYSVGFHKSNLREPLARCFYRHRVSPFDENQHVIYKNIHLIRPFLTEEPVDYPDYPLKNIPVDEGLQTFFDQNGLEQKRYVILNVGGGWQSKILPVETFYEILVSLKNKFKMVLLWGNGVERQRAGDLSQKTGVPVSDYFNFPQLINFIKLSRTIITSDTLAMHIADMVNTPSIGIFGPSQPSRNGSLLEESQSIYQKIQCSFCYKKKCDRMECLKTIDARDIVHAVNKVDETV
jgi:heptosyltransferase-1